MVKNVASIQVKKVATFNSDRKIINLIPKKSFRYENNVIDNFFDAFANTPC